MSNKDDAAIRAYLAKIAKKGGQARAKKYPPEVLRQWAKKGGRPKTPTTKRALEIT